LEHQPAGAVELKELKRRADPVSIFPNAAAVGRLVGAILNAQHDEWQTGRRYFSIESLARLLPPEAAPAPLAAG
jgi:transposase-like protein